RPRIVVRALVQPERVGPRRDLEGQGERQGRDPRPSLRQDHADARTAAWVEAGTRPRAGVQPFSAPRTRVRGSAPPQSPYVNLYSVTLHFLKIHQPRHVSLVSQRYGPVSPQSPAETRSAGAAKYARPARSSADGGRSLRSMGH